MHRRLDVIRAPSGYGGFGHAEVFGEFFACDVLFCKDRFDAIAFELRQAVLFSNFRSSFRLMSSAFATSYSV